MIGMIKDDRKIIRYYMLVSRGRANGNFIESDPVLGILLAVVLLELF